MRESSPESHEALNPAEEQTKNPLSAKTQFKTTSDGTFRQKFLSEKRKRCKEFLRKRRALTQRRARISSVGESARGEKERDVFNAAAGEKAPRGRPTGNDG